MQPGPPRTGSDQDKKFPDTGFHSPAFAIRLNRSTDPMLPSAPGFFVLAWFRLVGPRMNSARQSRNQRFPLTFVLSLGGARKPLRACVREHLLAPWGRGQGEGCRPKSSRENKKLADSSTNPHEWEGIRGQAARLGHIWSLPHLGP